MNRSSAVQVAFVLGSTGLAVFFVLAPGVDLWFSGLFYDASRGFHLAGAWWARLLHELVPAVTVAVALGILALIAYSLIRKRQIGPFRTRALLYLLAALVLGPGLVVNSAFKDHWGRARPRDVVEFGGGKKFTPAFVISDQCARNCSFVAGDPSVAFFFLAFAFLVRRRRYIYAAAISAGAVVGMARIVAGAHYLSDVVFSGIFVFIIAYLLYHYVFRVPGERDPLDSGSVET